MDLCSQWEFKAYWRSIACSTVGYIGSKIMANSGATARIESQTLREIVRDKRQSVVLDEHSSLTGRAAQLPQWEVDEERSAHVPEQHAGVVPVHCL